MKFAVKILDYGRHGVIAKEPRTRCTGEGDTVAEALDDIKAKLRDHIEHDYVPPREGPVESIVTITV